MVTIAAALPGRLATATGRAAALTAAAPGLIWLAARGLGLLVWWVLADATARPINLQAWDADYYVKIAAIGYQGAHGPPATAPGTPDNTLAFFPAYPWVIRLLAPLVGGHHLVAGVIVALGAGVVFAYGVRALAQRITGSSRAGLVAVVLVATVPMSVMFTVAYPEALFCALVVWALVAVHDGRWLLAAAATVGAGLTRAPALALVAVVMVAAAAAWWRTRRPAALVAVLLTPLGLGGVLASIAYRTGSLTGYTDIQAANWGVHLDGGVATAGWLLLVFTRSEAFFPIVCAVMMLFVLVAVLLSSPRLPTVVWAYGLVVVALTLASSGIMTTKPRELLAGFVLLIPLAGWLARQRPQALVTLAVGWAVVGMWVSAYSLTVWQGGI